MGKRGLARFVFQQDAPHENSCTLTLLLSVLEQFIKREADIFGNLTEQDGRDVSTLMKRHRCAAAGGIAELFV